MYQGGFQESGSLPAPKVVGRLVRVASGIGSLALFVWFLTSYDRLTDNNVPDIGWWIAVAIAFYYLPDMINVGLTLRLGRLPQIAALIVIVGLVIIDLAAYGTAWEAPLAWFFFLLAAAFYGSLGISFLVAGALGVPG